MKKNPSGKGLFLNTILVFTIALGILFGMPSISSAQDTAPQPTTEGEEPAATQGTPVIRLIEPAEGATIIGKKPVIRFALLDPANVQNLTVLLDGTDITSIMKQEGAEYVFKPVQPLSAGQHTLQITAKDANGQELSQEAGFLSRHTKNYEEAYSNNDLGLVYKERVDYSEEQSNSVDYRFDANLSSESKVKQGGFESSLTANLRYVTQDLPVEEPEKKWLSLVNFLWQTKYEKDKFSAESDVGDLTIDETALTAQGLARRGGKLGFAYDNYELHGFIVKSEELTGFEGGLGIEGPTSQHIMGVSTGANFFNEVLALKGTYITGGEYKNTYGVWSEMAPKKGNVGSLFAQLNLLDKKLILDGEYAESEFDGDLTDTYAAEEDKAYRYGFEGVYDIYSLKGRYEYFGPAYYTIANPSLQNNLEGFSLEGAASFKTQMLSLGYSKYNDNVEDDPLNPVVTTTHHLANYTFSGVTNLTLGLGYDRAIEKSSQEPAGTDPIDGYTTTYSTNISYLVWRLNLGLQASWSDHDDRTVVDADTETETYTFTPALTFDTLTITPSYAYNTTWDKSTSVTTDTYTTGLNFSGNFFEKRFLYDFAGTHNHTEISDLSSEQSTLSVTYKLAYILAPTFWGFTNPSIGIEGTYGSTHDYINDTDSHDKLVFLVFSTNLPINF